MQESEVKIIPQKQSFWWKIGGWLPVIIMSGIFFSISYVLQSIPPIPSPVSTGTEIVSDGVAWTSWVPLVLLMIFVFVAIVVAWTKKEVLQKWLKEKEKTGDEAKWFWYIVVAIITISASYVAPDKYNIVVAFVVALFGLHVVWLFLITAKTSTTTKVLVAGFFSFIIVAGLLPGTSTYLNAKYRVIKKDVAVKSEEEKIYADKYEKGITPESESARQSAAAPATYQPEKRLDVLWLVPGDDFKEIPISPGAKFNVECPPEAEALLYYRDAPRGKPYNCAEERVVANGVLDNLRIGFAIREIEDENGNMVPVTTEKVRIRVITEL